MATYYVRQDGNDANTGLGSAANLAWKTFQKALGATGATGGDIVYIAPGHYNEAVTVGGTYTSELQIVGDPTAAQFSGIQSGYVKLSQFSQPYNQARNNVFLITGAQNFLHFKNIYIDGSATGVNIAINLTGSNIKFTNCAFINNAKSTIASVFDINIGSSSVITRCVLFNFYSSNYASNSTHKNNLYMSFYGQSLYLGGTGHIVTNCTFIGNGVGVLSPNTGSGCSVYNSLFIGNDTGFQNNGVSTHANNRYIGNTINVNNAWTLTDGGGNVTNGTTGIDLGYASINNITSGMFFGSLQDSQNIGTGNTITSLPTDIYGTTWYGVNPDIGAITYRPTVITGQYNPTERNSSTITISPASTSQSIELYLGVTGLTATTAGLTARYNRTRSASVNIPLVTRTITQPWISGGFAEVDTVNMPGIYRLDIPNEALISGADDVTITVRGASGTNGAVVTIKLLGIAQEVWNPNVNDFTLPNSFGARVVQTTADNRDVNVTAGNQIQIDNEQTFYPTAGQDLDAITEDVGRWTLRNNVLTLYAPDGTYLRRVRLSALGITL
jgi:hypothetical protein